MSKAGQQSPQDFDWAMITFLPDLSKLTLDQLQALKPLPSLLQDSKVPYSWGFPFHLKIQCEGRTHIIRRPEDILQILHLMTIPAILPIPTLF